MFRSLYFRLGLISSLTALALLVVLPRININLDNKFVKLNSYIGGYKFSLFDGKYNFDFTSFKRGLDLEGGVRIVLQAKLDTIDSVDYQKAVDSAVQVLERRVNLLGVAEPYIAPVKVGGDYRIIVEIPGLSNIEDAVSLVGQTAQLKFKTLKSDLEWTSDKYEQYYFSPDSWEDTGVTGADLKGAEVIFDPNSKTNINNSPNIKLIFTKEGLSKFSEIAKQNVGKPISIFLDQEPIPISMAIVDQNLAGGLVEDPVISGNFDYKQAQSLSVQIRAGALPISVEIIEQKSIGATLGTQSVQKSLFAGVIGLIFVLIFMIYMYKKFGILACASLIIYTILTLAVFKIVPVVLTMPGIAGFILSVGMASDANILIFERIKEEILWGKPQDLAIKNGFERAWTSIRDSNISSLITSYILFEFGTGPVKGFALTLSLGIMISLFTSIFVVKTLIEVFNIGNYRRTIK